MLYEGDGGTGGRTLRGPEMVEFWVIGCLVCARMDLCVWTEKTDVEEEKDEEEEEEGDLFLTPSGTQLLHWTRWCRKREREEHARFHFSNSC